MADLNKIPLIDGFETTLSQPWNGGLGTVNLNDVPSFTFPSGVTTYIVVNPGRSNMQVAEIDSKGVGTVNVSSITVEKGAGVNYTAQTHLAGSTVIISDNYQFWKDIRTAINTKLDIDGGNGLRYATEVARDAALGGDGVATEGYRNIFVESTNLYYNYNLGLAQWQSIDTGTSPGNATTTNVGLVELATPAQVVAGTNTEGGNPLVVQPADVKLVSDSIAANVVQIKDKVDVVCATTANITLSNTQTIDGVAVTAGQRVLVKNQTAGAENGIYVCVSGGAWTRATDFDTNTNNEVDLGATIWVQGGTVNDGTKWVLSTTGTITVGTTALVFRKIYPFVDMGCRLIQTTGTSIALNSWGTISFDTEDYDTDTYHDTSTNNDRITIPTGFGGKYEIFGQAAFSTANSSIRGIRILKNGSEIACHAIGTSTALSGGTDLAFNISTVANLAASDYLQLQVYNASGSANTTTTTRTFFGIQRKG